MITPEEILNSSIKDKLFDYTQEEVDDFNTGFDGAYLKSMFQAIYKGIDSSMTIDNSVHSFFGVSKCAADLLTQEFGKNLGLKTVVFRLGCITGPAHSGAQAHGFLSYLTKCVLRKKKYTIFW